MTKYNLIVPSLALLLAACAGPSPNTVQLAEERHTCAAMGNNPGSQAIGQCVGDLDATRFEEHDTAGR